MLTDFLYPRKENVQLAAIYNDDIVEKTLSYMSQNIEKKLTLEGIAAYNKISASYLSNLFRTTTGTSPIDYFIQMKIRPCL